MAKVATARRMGVKGPKTFSMCSTAPSLDPECMLDDMNVEGKHVDDADPATEEKGIKCECCVYEFAPHLILNCGSKDYPKFKVTFFLEAEEHGGERRNKGKGGEGEGGRGGRVREKGPSVLLPPTPFFIR